MGNTVDYSWREKGEKRDGRHVMRLLSVFHNTFMRKKKILVIY